MQFRIDAGMCGLEKVAVWKSMFGHGHFKKSSNGECGKKKKRKEGEKVREICQKEGRWE